MTKVNIHEAKTHFSRLLEKAAVGEEVLIARAGKPVARLVPVGKTGRARKLGLLAGKLKVPADFDAALPASVLASFEGR